MPSLLPITACQVLASAAGPDRCMGVIDHWLGDAWKVEHPDGLTIAAWCGSRAAYRLLGSWAGGPRLPVRATFKAAPAPVGTVVTVTMSSDEGRYMLNAPGPEPSTRPGSPSWWPTSPARGSHRPGPRACPRATDQGRWRGRLGLG